MNIPLFSSQVILPNEDREVSSDFSQQGCRMSELARETGETSDLPPG
jgi:hypothetical protein